MSISIVIPTIGSPSRKIVKDAIESALITDPDLWPQIIIVDNSKNSEFNNFLKNITKEDPRVEIHQVNHPMTMAGCWNYGLNLVKNKWHLYLHDDDILKSKNLPIEILENDVGFINFGFEVFGHESWTYKPQESGLKGICKNTPKFVSTLLNTNSLRATGGWNERSGYFLDYLAFIKLNEQFGSISRQEILGKYRLHSSNASSKDKRNETYGNAFPYVLSEVFKVIENENERRDVLFSMLSFAYPNNSLGKKMISNLSKSFGYQAWLK